MGGAFSVFQISCWLSWQISVTDDDSDSHSDSDRCSESDGWGSEVSEKNDEAAEPEPKTKRRVEGTFGFAPVGKKRKPWRPSFCDRYPALPTIVQQILNCHPGGANRQRSQTTTYSTLTMEELHRLTCQNLQQHCLDFGIPEPNPYPSPKVIRRIGLAPNPRFKTASHYKNKVPFRTAPRNNDATVWHPDFHLTAANVKLFSEMACYFDDDCVFLSCDNKNKVRFGAPANPNMTRPRGMYLTNNQPSLPDHSFPTREGHIVPMGYMRLARKRVRHSSIHDNSGFQ